MKIKLKKFAMAAALGFAFVFTLSACSSTDMDADGDGEFKMSSSKQNSIGSYQYEFYNRSDYKVTLTVNNGSKINLEANRPVSYTVSNDKNNIKVKYIPADKVKPESGGSTIWFKNR